MKTTFEVWMLAQMRVLGPNEDSHSVTAPKIPGLFQDRKYFHGISNLATFKFRVKQQ